MSLVMDSTLPNMPSARSSMGCMLSQLVDLHTSTTGYLLSSSMMVWM